MNIKLEIDNTLWVNEKELKAFSTKKQVEVKKRFIIDFISDGGNLQALELGNGDLPSRREIQDWQEDDKDDFYAEFKTAENRRNNIAREEYYHLSSLYKRNPTPELKDQVAAASKEVESIDRKRVETPPKLVFHYKRTIPEDAWSTKADREKKK